MKQLFKKLVVIILTLEAKMLLRRTRPHIIAITGSVGKTSAKDAIYAAMKDYVKVRKSEKSFNSEIGVALTVLGLRNAWNNPIFWAKNIIDGFITAIHPGSYPDYLILEMGVDRPGDMARLCQWISPDVVVLTRLPDVPVHVEYFASPEAVIAEKLELVKALKQDGVLVYNQDDPKIAEVAEDIPQEAIAYSRYSLSPFTASADKLVYKNGKPVGMEFTLTHNDEAVTMFVRESIGVQHAYNYAAAAAVASVYGISLSEANLSLANHIPPAGRMRLLSGVKDTLVIDDTYNSSPTAAERSLQALRELRGTGRKIVVMGDMLELGKYSVSEHEHLGQLASVFADVLVTIGVRSRSIASGALEHGMSEKKIFQYDDINRAGREIQDMLRPGDVILIKGSQGVRCEKIVLELMAEPERAAELIVRQDSAWDNR